MGICAPLVRPRNARRRQARLGQLAAGLCSLGSRRLVIDTRQAADGRISLNRYGESADDHSHRPLSAEAISDLHAAPFRGRGPDADALEHGHFHDVLWPDVVNDVLNGSRQEVAWIRQEVPAGR